MSADPVPSAPLRQRAEEETLSFLSRCSERQKHGEHGKPTYGGPCSQRVERCIRCVIAQAVEDILAVREEATRAERERLDVEAMRANLHATFSGGHHDNPAALRAFHHGMDTVCNVLEADQKGASTNGILPAAADPGEGTRHE